MTRKVYCKSKNNKYNRNPRYRSYRRHTKKIVQSGGGDQKTYYRFIQRGEDGKVSTHEIEKALEMYDVTDNRVVVIDSSTGTNMKIVVMINTESNDDEIIATLDKYIASKKLDKRFGSFVRTVQSSYTIEAPPNDPKALEKAKAYFGDKNVAESPIVKQSVRGSGITVNTFIENLKKIKIKDKSGNEKSLEISSQSPADGGTITVKTPYKIVNLEKVPIEDGAFKYVDIIPNKNVTDKLDEFLKAQPQVVLQPKGDVRMVISDASIKTTKNLSEYPDLEGPTHISLNFPPKSKISKLSSESGNDADGTKRFTQTITGVGADIIGELKSKGLDVKINGNDMEVRPKTGSKIDKIVDIAEYGISVPVGTVKYVDVFTKPTDVLMENLRRLQQSENGILKTKGTGENKTATFISDTWFRQSKNITVGNTYLALKLPTGKVEEPAVRLTVAIDDSNLEEKKKLSKFLIQNPKYKVYDAAGNDVTITLQLEPGERSEEILKMALKELLKEKPNELLNALNVMPSSFSFLNAGDKSVDKKFHDLYKVLIDDNAGLKEKSVRLKIFSKSTSLIIKPTDNPTKISLYHLLVTLDGIGGDAVGKKNAAAQFFNSLKEIFNSLYKDKLPSDPSNPVESFIRKLYDPSYSQPIATPSLKAVALLTKMYLVARDVASLVVEKINKSFATEGGRLTRKKVLNRRNKKKSHRSKIN